MDPEPISPSFSLVMPTLNELEGLQLVVPALDRSLFAQILVVDGGSSDGTLEYARDQGLEIFEQDRPGLAAGILDARKHIRGDIVIMFSADGNCKVEYLKPLMDVMRAGYDLVVVSRYLYPAHSEDDDWLTAFGNRFFTSLIRLAFGVRVTDSLGMYRAFKKSLLTAADVDYYAWGPVLEPLLVALAGVNHQRVEEIPGDEPRRVGGTRKMRPFVNGTYVLIMIVRVFLLRLGFRL